MALPKLTIAPNQSGYAVSDGVEVISTQLDGGMARYRRDILGANALVSVQWSLSPLEFKYVKDFFNLLTGRGAKAFLLDLYLDDEVLTEHTCMLLPGSFRLTGQRGQQFTISAQIDATPVKLTSTEEEARRVATILYGELGPEYTTLFPPLECDTDQLVTLDIPEAMMMAPVPGGLQALTGNIDGLEITDDIGMFASPRYTNVKALGFDGISQYTCYGVDVPPPDPEGFSGHAWVNVSVLEMGPAAILGSGFLFGGVNGYGLYISASGKFSMQVRDGSGASTAEGSVGNDGLWHFVEFGYDGAAPWVRVDGGGTFFGPAKAISSFLNANGFVVGARVDDVGGHAFFCDMQLGHFLVIDSIGGSSGEGEGTTAFDITGNGVHGVFGDGSTVSTFPTHVTVGGVALPSYNQQYGTKEFEGVSIPGILDGSTAADGGTVSNVGGLVNNGSGAQVVQVGVPFDTFGASQSFWGDGVSVWDPKSLAQMDLHPNGKWNLWLMYRGALVVGAWQYPVAQVFTPTERLLNSIAFGVTPGGTYP